MIFINLNSLISQISLLSIKKYIPFMVDEEYQINIKKFFSKNKQEQERNNFSFIIKNNIKVLKESLSNNILILEKEKNICYNNSDSFLSHQDFKLLEKYLKTCDKDEDESNKYNIFNLCKLFYNIISLLII